MMPGGKIQFSGKYKYSGLRQEWKGDPEKGPGGTK